MASWFNYIPMLLKWEGGFSNNPADKGGATNRGVTMATFRKWYGADRTVEDLKAMTDCQWCRIMRSYWDNVKADQIRSQSIADLVVDWHVNAGVNAIKRIQRMFGIKADGIVGPITLTYLNSPNAEVIFNRLRSAREDYYIEIVKGNPSQQQFLNGWLRRTRSFEYHN
jgi:lysozyme family protein